MLLHQTAYAALRPLVKMNVAGENMKILIAILVLGVGILLASDLKSTTSTKTKGNRATTTETFTRSGVTDLVRNVTVRDGNVLLVRQRIYHAGVLALEMNQMDNGLTCVLQPEAAVRVGTHYTAEGNLDNVNLMMTNSIVTVDHFTVTNGLLYPVSRAEIKKANEIGTDVADFITSVTNRTPEQSREELRELLKKHKAD